MTLFGIDVSRYQAGIDLHRAAGEGVAFVIAKATQGAGYRSPAWPAQRDGARAAGLLLAAYHYVTADPPAAQAANAAAWVGDPAIPFALDWEAPGVDAAHFAAVLGAFRAAGLHPVLGYVPRWYHGQQGGPDLSRLGITLWASRYPSPAAGTPAGIYSTIAAASRAACWAPYGGLAPALWQFTDRASVAGLRVDADAFEGTRDQLAALLSPPAPVAPVVAPATRRAGEEDNSMLITTPALPDVPAKHQWPAERISFGFDPPGGWGGRCVIKLHWTFPGGWVHEAKWWVRHGDPGTVGIPNRPHDAVPIDLAGQQERYVGLGWELTPPERADELEVVISAPGGVHIFSVYER
jgi:hypothetical protein